MNHSERWRSIPGFPGYEASSEGRVRYWRGDSDLPAVVNIGLTSDGYRRARLVGAPNSLVHRLVAAAFLGSAPADRPLVLHADGDRANNRLANLRYGNAKDNAADRERHGRTVRGEASPCAKAIFCFDAARAPTMAIDDFDGASRP